MENDSIKPGQTVTPGSGSTPPAPAEPPAPAPEPLPVPAEPPAPIPAPQPAPEEAAPEPEPVPPEEQPPAEEPKFNNSPPETETETAPDQNDTAQNAQSITWSASEFIDHTKSPGWYTALGLAALVLAALVFFMTKDPVSVAVIIVAALIFGVYAGHKPRELQYQLNFKGLTIGEKHFSYDQFRSFSVLPEGAFSSIVFMPLKRFALTTTIYYAPEDENKIVDLLSDHLPLEERGHDAIDRLMHRIHF